MHALPYLFPLSHNIVTAVSNGQQTLTDWNLDGLRCWVTHSAINRITLGIFYPRFWKYNLLPII